MFSSPAWLELCSGDVNLAVLCGDRSGGLVGIDFDDDVNGLEFDGANPHLAGTWRITGARGWKILLRIRGPYPPSEATPECEWRADGNLCHVSGVHPKGMPYRLLVEAEPLEVAFDEIVWPEGWTVPGVTRASEEALAGLTSRFGPPVFTNAKGEPVQINEGFWAGMYLAEHQTVWTPEEEAFYRYDEASGIWRFDDVPAMRRRLRELLVAQSKAMNLGWVSRQATTRTLAAITTQIQNESCKRGVFYLNRRTENIVHTANVVIAWRGDQWLEEEFSPEFYSRNASPILYDPMADCPRFKSELLSQCLDSDDAELLQLLAGMFLLGRNILQLIVIIDGAAGTGKSQLVKVIQGLVGKVNCCGLRTELLHERFETAQFIGKTLLIGSDVSSRFLLEPGAKTLKSLVGGDSVAAELKNTRGSIELDGVFNVLITSNARLRMRLDDDAEAWRRRVVILRSEAQKPARAVENFGELLLEREGPGILNWGLGGVIRLRDLIAQHGARIRLTARQQERVDRALSESDSLRLFLVDRVRWDAADDVTTEEVLEAYAGWCNDQDLIPLPDAVAQKQLPSLMLEIFQVARVSSIQRDGKSRKGYSRIKIAVYGNTLSYSGTDGQKLPGTAGTAVSNFNGD